MSFLKQCKVCQAKVAFTIYPSVTVTYRHRHKASIITIKNRNILGSTPEHCKHTER